MKSIIGRLEIIAELLLKGQWSYAFKRLRRWIYWDTFAYGLRRDLPAAFEPSPAKIPLKIRPLQDPDIEKLFGSQRSASSGEEAYQLKHRLNFLSSGIRTCYVASTRDDQPCFMQWLVGASENEKLQKYFFGLHAPLAPDEALMEDVFTVEAFRGQAVMPCAMARIAEKGRDIGVRWVITFVNHKNPAAMKGCKRAGFSPYLIRRETWRLFRRRVSFTPLPEGAAYIFEVAVRTESSKSVPSRT